MQKVQSFKIKNFKYFYGEVPFDVRGKNLLIFGQNGSGKSSIYWALYTFLQSVYKPDRAQIDKYFDRATEVNLVNRFAPVAEPSSIVVEFINEHQTITRKEISLTVQNVNDGTLVKEAAHASDFLNYRALLNVYNFSNATKIDLFPLFEAEFMQFIQFGAELVPGSSVAVDAWRYIARGPQPGRPNMNTAAYRDFQAIVSGFNEELGGYLNTVLETANEIFREHFSPLFRIQLEYIRASYNDFFPGSTTRRTHSTKRPQILMTVDFAHNMLPPEVQPLNRPQTFLNEARLSSIALCLRLAILDEKYIDSAAKILVIDDLLISLDMENRDQVLDLILNRYRGYQLFVMTHDRSFFNLTKHRIVTNGWAGQWSMMEMYADETAGGIPKPFIPDNHDYLDQAHKYLKEFDYPACANYLRKETERLLKKLMPRNLTQYITDEGSKSVQLDTLIENFKKHLDTYGVDFNPFLKLKEYKDLLLNPLSHDNIHTPVYKSELLAIIEKIQQLRTMNFVTLIDIAPEGNNMVYLEETSSTGVHWTYKIELLENYSYLTTSGGPMKFIDPECRFIERTTAGAEPESLGNRRKKLSIGHENIRHALGIIDDDPHLIEAILRNAAGQYIIDMILQVH
jgi:energy-coupling factor transporter ATP-binding protein EcfA2